MGAAVPWPVAGLALPLVHARGPPARKLGLHTPRHDVRSDRTSDMSSRRIVDRTPATLPFAIAVSSRAIPGWMWILSVDLALV